MIGSAPAKPGGVASTPLRDPVALTGPLTGVSFVAAVRSGLTTANSPYPRPGSKPPEILRYFGGNPPPGGLVPVLPPPGERRVQAAEVASEATATAPRATAPAHNDQEPRPGPNLMSVVRKRIRIQGFIVSDQWQRWGEYRALAAPMLRAGQLKYREDIVDGIDKAPDAFIGLLQGRNFGKLLVRLAADPTR